MPASGLYQLNDLTQEFFVCAAEFSIVRKLWKKFHKFLKVLHNTIQVCKHVDFLSPQM